MWWDLEPIPSPIRVHHLVGVDAQISKRVDGHEHVADVGVDLAMLETLLQVVVDSFVGYFAQKC